MTPIPVMATRRLGMSGLFGYERSDTFDYIANRAERANIIIRYRDLELVFELENGRDHVEGIESQFDQGAVRRNGFRGPAFGLSKNAYYFIDKRIRHKTFTCSFRPASPGAAERSRA
jgi:hypothetical protein